MLTYEDARYRDVELTLASHFYRGRSVGSQVTCHQFPGHDVVFDMGPASLSSLVVPNVVLTHGHDDHVGGIWAHHLRRVGNGLDPARYFIQEGDIDAVRGMVQAHARINRSRGDESIQLNPIGEGAVIPVGKGGLVVKPFRSTHRVPCLGYALWGKRRRLRADLIGASKEIIIAARKRGKEVNEEVQP